jgi:hypothetical protein
MAVLILVPSCIGAEQGTNLDSPSSQTSILPSTTELDLPLLQSSDNLKRNCQPKIAETRDSYRNEGLRVGTTAIDFTLKDTSGNEITLSKLLKEKPVVMILGSFT